MSTDLAVLTRPFNRESIRRRRIGGGAEVDYIPGDAVIRRLNDATGNTWSMTVDRYWFERLPGARQGAPERLLAFALVTLTIPDHGSRQHVGVQADSGGGEDLLAKGAVTDALKKAATLFGVGLELYGDDHEGGNTPASRSEGSPRVENRPREQSPSRPIQDAPRPAQRTAGDDATVSEFTLRQLRIRQERARMDDAALNARLAQTFGAGTIAETLTEKNARLAIGALETELRRNAPG